jgi:hypothetical protein
MINPNARLGIPSSCHYLHRRLSEIQDEGIHGLFRELSCLRANAIPTTEDPVLHEFFQSFFIDWRTKKFVKIESSCLTVEHHYLQIKVRDLEKTEMYKLLRDLCGTRDNPERHHKQRLYQALNCLTPHCLPKIPKTKPRKPDILWTSRRGAHF